MKGQTNITGILNRGVILRVDKLDQLVSAMGYKIMVVPNDVKPRDGWYEVDFDPTPGPAEKNTPPGQADLKIARKIKKETELYARGEDSVR